jgi:hypothetical protein
MVSEIWKKIVKVIQKYGTWIVVGVGGLVAGLLMARDHDDDDYDEEVILTDTLRKASEDRQRDVEERQSLTKEKIDEIKERTDSISDDELADSILRKLGRDSRWPKDNPG